MSTRKVSSEELMKLVQRRAVPEESERLLALIESDDELAREYEELCDTARILDELAALEPQPAPSVADGVLEQLPARARPAWVVPATAVAACSLALVMIMTGESPPPGITVSTSPSTGWQGTTKYNDARIVNATNAMLSYLEGTLGALVMVAAGLSALFVFLAWSVKPTKRLLVSWLTLVAIAIGAFVFRTAMSTYFNDDPVISDR